MFFGYFRSFNLICNVFGVLKPNINAQGKSTEIHLWVKLWPFLVAVAAICSYFLSLHGQIDLDVKNHLEIIPDINDVVGNVVIILINLINSEKICINIHEILEIVLMELHFDDKVLKLFAIKIHFWVSAMIFMFFILVIMEFVYNYPPYILLIRTPIFLTILNLIMYLFLILAILKVVNRQISRTLNCNSKILSNKNLGIRYIINYVFSPGIDFLEIDNLILLDTQSLCKIYDNLSTSIHLLEKCYGLQIFISIWSMFTSAVVGVTVIVCNQATIKWLVVTKSILPIFWCYIACYISDQLSKETAQTNTLIIKCLIDYRCVPPRKAVLETFKELANNDRLQFSACSLFNLSYAMLLGTLLNVITYSIILIQLFMGS